MHLLRNHNNVPSIYPSIRPSGSVGLNDAVAVLAGGEKARDVCSVVMFCFDLFQKFRLPIGLHGVCVCVCVYCSIMQAIAFSQLRLLI